MPVLDPQLWFAADITVYDGLDLLVVNLQTLLLCPDIPHYIYQRTLLTITLGNTNSAVSTSQNRALNVENNSDHMFC